MSPLRQLRAILLLPGIVLGAVPATLVITTRSFNLAWSTRGLIRWVLAFAGGGAILAGLALLGHAIHLFATVGHGTLAPWDPARHLVVAGAYRHVRNPMYLGTLLALAGEALLAGSLWLVGWWLLVVTAFHLRVRLVEEPYLQAQYGDTYTAYRDAVPRWLPRQRPWEPPAAGQ